MKRTLIFFFAGCGLALLGNYAYHRDPLRDLLDVTLQATNSDRVVEGGRLVQQPGQGRKRVEAGTNHSNSAEKMHYTVLQAFREAIGNNWMATVRVYEGNRQVAMGAIVDRDGWAITKSSEVKTDAVECRLYDGTRVVGTIATRRSDVDLALIQLKKTALPTLEWSDSAEVSVGKWLATTDIKAVPMAIGVVSVGPRNIRPEKAVLGVSFEWTENGNMVTMVLPGSGADRAGIRVNDVIKKINGQPLTSRQAMLEKIGGLKAGNRIELAVLRDKSELQLEAKLMDLNNTLLDPTEMEVNGEISSRSTGFASVLQHDTVLTPYQCGGPVVDLTGKAVGLNIARAGRVSSYAIPASLVQSSVREMMAAVKNEALASKESKETVIRAQDSGIGSKPN